MCCFGYRIDSGAKKPDLKTSHIYSSIYDYTKIICIFTTCRSLRCGVYKSTAEGLSCVSCIMWRHDISRHSCHMDTFGPWRKSHVSWSHAALHAAALARVKYDGQKPAAVYATIQRRHKGCLHAKGNIVGNLRSGALPASRLTPVSLPVIYNSSHDAVVKEIEISHLHVFRRHFIGNSIDKRHVLLQTLCWYYRNYNRN